MAIRIPIIADVVDAIRGSKKLGESFDDVADALQDVDRQSAGAGAGVQDVGDHAADTTRDAQDMESSFRDAFEAVRKEAKSTGNVVSQEMHDGTDGGSEGLNDLRGEAQQTSAEVAASFDGSAESIAGGFQELAANAFAGFGPAGAIAGAAAAAGIGIAVGKLQEAADKANELAEEAGAFALEMRDAGDAAGRVAVLSQRWDEVATAIQDAKSWWEVWQPKAVTNIERFSQAAKVGGVNIKAMFDAFNDPNPISRLAKMNDFLQDTTRLQEEAKQAATDYANLPGNKYENDVHEALIAKRDAIADVVTTMKDEVATSQAAADITKALAEAEGLTVGQYMRRADAAEQVTEVTKSNTEALEESTAALQDNLDKQNTAADAARGLFDAETALAGAVAAATKQLTENKAAGLDPATEAGRANRDALSGMAGAYDAAADAIDAAGGSQADANAKILEGREAVIKQGEALGLSTQDAARYADQLGLVPTRVDTKLLLEQDKAGVADAQAKYDGLGRPISTKVTLVADTTALDKDLARMRTVQVQIIAANRAGAAVPI